MEKIAIITDTDCDLAPEELAALGVQCVPLSVTGAGGETFGTQNTSDNIERYYDHLAGCDDLPKTSMPSPVDFANLFSQLALDGYTHALMVLIPETMSGTAQAARLAAQSTSLCVDVVETHRNTLALGLIVRKLAHMRADGATYTQLVTAAGSLHRQVDIVFVVDTLKNLVKGGRTGKAVGLAAALLDIKPVLTVDDDGEVVTLAKVRSMKRALPKLADVAEELVERLGALEGYFVHVRNRAGADKLRELFEQRGIAFEELCTRQVGPVIATHVGLGTVGFAYIAKDTAHGST